MNCKTPGGMSVSYFLELAGMFFIPLTVVIVPVLMGQRIGIYHRTKTVDIQHIPIESVIAAAFGLLAFMLAFTFQIAANRYTDRKEMLIREVTDIRTVYLRAGLIPEPYNSNTRNQIVEYIDIRVALLEDFSKLDSALFRSQAILDSLWKYSEALAIQDRSSEAYSLYTTSVNDLVDAYNKRITMVFIYRIPTAILWVLFIIGFLSMLMLGYQFGISGKGNFGINVLLAVIFAVVMFLISALNEPETGLVKVNQQPLLNLQKQILDRKEERSVKPL
jgi:hypothetical protein